MKLMIVVLVVVSACKLKEPVQWDGIPADRICSSVGPSTQATCIAGGKVYQCIMAQGSTEFQRPTRMLCSRDTVEVKCTNIVNVETVCPAKP